MELAIAAFTAFLVAALPLSVGVTKAVDLIRNLVDSGARAPRWVWNVVAFAVGIGLCWGWGFNLMAALVAAIPALSSSTMFAGSAGSILTGIAVGAMAGFWHDKLNQWSSAAVASQATAGLPVTR